MIDRPDNTVQDVGDDSTPPLGWAEYAIVSVRDNYLICKAYDGSETYGDNIDVAKDPDLRKSSYHGMTISGLTYDYGGPSSRKVTNSSAEFRDQLIVPAYAVPANGPAGFPGSIILAIPKLTIVRNDADSDDVVCQYCELTNRAWANNRRE